MADQIKKIEMRQRGDGSYNEILYPKTSTDMVVATSGNTVQKEIDDLKSSVSSGKNEIASAITAMGQSANGSETHASLANKIKAISNDANATVAQVLNGQTFYQGGVKRTGTMANQGGARTITPSTTNQVLNAGYYSGNITVSGSSNLTAGNIRSGVNIFGVVGNVIPGGRSASGSGTVNNDLKVVVSGLSFRPRVVIVEYMSNVSNSGSYYQAVYFGSTRNTMFNRFLTHRWTGFIGYYSDQEVWAIGANSFELRLTRQGTWMYINGGSSATVAAVGDGFTYTAFE